MEFIFIKQISSNANYEWEYHILYSSYTCSSKMQRRQCSKINQLNLKRFRLGTLNHSKCKRSFWFDDLLPIFGWRKKHGVRNVWSIVSLWRSKELCQYFVYVNVQIMKLWMKRYVSNKCKMQSKFNKITTFCWAHSCPISFRSIQLSVRICFPLYVSKMFGRKLVNSVSKFEMRWTQWQSKTR